MTVRKYNFDESSKVGDIGIQLVIDFLHSETAMQYWYHVKQIESVENNHNFQKQGIDLLATTSVEGAVQPLTIEVKADTNSHTGNFFLETVSDKQKKTKGAFVASAAEWF